MLHFLAREMNEGRVPYRDLFDMNLPGSYLIHRLTLALLGPGDLGVRLLDLAMLLIAAAGLLLAAGRAGGTIAAALLALAHLAAGPYEAAQRDLLVASLALAAVGIAPRPGRAAMFLAALLVGLAATVKPHALLFAPLLLLARPAPLRPGPWALGLGIGPGLALAWLTAIGGLQAFLDLLGGYVLPLYSGVHPESRWRWARDTLLAPRFVWLYAILGLGLLGSGSGSGSSSGSITAGRGPRAGGRWPGGEGRVIGLGLLLGLLYYAAQGKGWPYHALPALGFLCLGAGRAAARLLERGSRPLGVLLLALLTAASWHLTLLGRTTLTWPAVRLRLARTAEIVERLRPHVGRAAGGAKLQIFDTAQGGAHVLLQLGAHQPTRFLYDFHFYHDVESEYVTRLRAELVARLRADPPARVLLFEDNWLRPRYKRLDGFPELKAWLESGYAIESEGYGYRIYAPR